MKDLTEALLIEMERRADALVEACDKDPGELSRYDLKDTYNDVRHKAEAVAKDVTELCARARVSA
jgi:hypothetical protein